MSISYNIMTKLKAKRGGMKMSGEKGASSSRKPYYPKITHAAADNSHISASRPRPYTGNTTFQNMIKKAQDAIDVNQLKD